MFHGFSSGVGGMLQSKTRPRGGEIRSDWRSLAQKQLLVSLQDVNPKMHRTGPVLGLSEGQTGSGQVGVFPSWH